jgi:hypothetical protein
MRRLSWPPCDTLSCQSFIFIIAFIIMWQFLFTYLFTVHSLSIRHPVEHLSILVIIFSISVMFYLDRVSWSQTVDIWDHKTLNVWKWGTVLCIAECLTISLASSHQTSRKAFVTAKIFPINAKYPLENKSICDWEAWVWSIGYCVSAEFSGGNSTLEQ